MNDRLDISASPWVVIAALFLWLVTAWLAWRQWRRFSGLQGSRAARGTLAMEVLRLLAATAIVIMLLKPEWVRVRETDEQPVVAVIQDGTGSMETLDVLTGDTQARKAVTRRAWTEEARGTGWSDVLGTGVPVAEAPLAGETDKGSDLGGALDAALGLGRRLRAILVVSDGDWTVGASPLEAAARSKLRGVPIFAVGVGHDEHLPDLAMEQVRAPGYALAGERVSIPFVVRNHFNEDKDTVVQLREDGVVVAQKNIRVAAGGSAEDALVWLPSREGRHVVDMHMPPVEGEAVRENNAAGATVEVRQTKLKVLVIDAEPRWEFRYLKNAIERDPGVEGSYLLYHPGIGVGGGKGYLEKFPDSKDKLGAYDVVFLGDVGKEAGQLTDADVELLAGLVKNQASGLVFLPGIRGRQLSLVDTALADLLPVEYDPQERKGRVTIIESRMILTELGRTHLLTLLAPGGASNEALWRSLPGFQWSAAAKRARSGSEVLAVHSDLRGENGRLPLLVTRTAGSGKTLYLGTDGAWRWRRGVEDRYHYRFWGQVVRWMAHQRHLAEGEDVRITYSPENPTAGETLFVQATVLSGGFPVEGADVVMRLSSQEPDGGTPRSISLKQVEGGWGVYGGTIDLAQGGPHELEVINRSGPQKLKIELPVGSPSQEPVGRPANLRVLEQIAGLTSGKYAAYDRWEDVMSALRLAPEPRAEEIRIPLWGTWWAGALVFAMLVGYWVWRKAAGML